MNALSVVRELPAFVLSPVLCRLVGHRWHPWPQHAATTVRVCDRCFFVVDDPYRI